MQGVTTTEAAQLRALIWAAFNDSGNLREHAERIVEWHYLRPLARGDLATARGLARAALEAELERLRAHPPLTADELVALLRRTAFASDYDANAARVGVVDSTTASPGAWPYTAPAAIIGLSSPRGK